MSFGFGGGAFGASSSPFGATSPSPFGQQTQAPAFGQTSPFGATTSTGVFGQSQPAFGAAPAVPAFGASPAPAFGAPASSSAFGAAPAFGAKPAFGAFGAAPAAASPFGAATSQPAFGAAASAPAFGAASTPAFGASPFGATPAFGASAPAFGQAAPTPAFGQASSPAFGQTGLTAFGSTTFGGAAQATGGFGAGGFGAGARGTRAVAYRKTQEQDSSTTGAKSVVYFNSISCMPEYASKSVEELRAEDYQDGCKGNTGAASPAAGGFGTSTFGASPSSSPFGAPASSPAFGSSAPAFGAASAPAFGASPAPAFGSFGATASPAPFGQSAPAFGAASSAPAFGGFGAAASSPGFGFGAASSSAFGAPASSPAFGQASAPAFGGFGAATSSPFGATSPSPFGQSAPAFGAPSSTPAFGGFGATSAPAFGATSAPAFGATSAAAFGATSAPAFGFGAASTPGFGAASSASLFGASSTPAFGTGGSLFGSTQQKPATGFGFGAASTPAFGAAPTPAFGASSTSLFGAASTPAFGTGTSLFGASQAAPSFSFAPAQPAAATPGGTMVQAQQVQAPGVATSPYGVLPEPPKVSPAPEYKVGLTQRPAGLLAGGPPRPAALITPRSITPRSGVRMRPRHSMSATRMSRSPADFLAVAQAQAAGGTPGGGGGADGRAGSATPNGSAASGSIFVPRENPRRLFVRDALPSTEAAGTTTASPALGATPGRPPLRTPGSGLRITPGTGRRADGTGGGPSGSAGGVSTGIENGGHALLAENGFGPAGGGADGELSDAQLASLLPSLKQPDYYTEPSLQQLAAMARDDPACLCQVSNFTVGRRGVGSVRWLEPVDVRGLDLDATVQLSKGSIEVYLDESAKPEVGQGLNRPAEVTMLRIHKLDKQTGKPTADPEAVDRFTRKLKKVTAEQGARFVSYDASSGTWKFEVEHFSKYGLLDSDDEEEEAAAGTTGAAGTAAAAGGRGRRDQQNAAAAAGEDESSDEELQRFAVSGRRGRAARGGGGMAGGIGGEEAGAAAGLEGEGEPLGDDDEDLMQDSLGRRGSGGEEEMLDVDGEGRGQELSFGAMFAAEGGAGAGSRALQLSLPAQMGMEPEDLQRIRDGLYASTQQARQPPAKQRRILTVGAPQQAAMGAAAGPAAAAAAAPVAAAAAASAAAATRPALAARNAWRKQQAAPVRPPAAARAAAPRTPPTGGLPPLLPAGPTPVSTTGKQCLVPAPRSETGAGQQAERCLPDAGLYGGAAFRCGWAPNAVLAHAGGRASSAGHVVVRQVATGARLAPAGEPVGARSAFQERQRTALEAALQLHMKHSSAEAEGGAEGGAIDGGDSGAAMDGEEQEQERVAAGVPRWRLRCKRHGELRELTLRYIELCNAAAAEAQDAERTVLRHQATTWELLHVLFSAIQGEQLPSAAAQTQQLQRNGQQQDGEQQDGEDGEDGVAVLEAAAAAAAATEDGEELQLDRLAAFKRRAQLSHWLRDRARPLVEAALRSSSSSGGGGSNPAGASSSTSSDAIAAQLLALLSGHQVAAAAALAAASGNVRLATLLAQAGTKAVGGAELAEQLRVWGDSGCERHISAALRRVYQLLAGQVDEVTPSLQLDWRRALGVHLWYGCHPTATVSDALASYTAAVEAGAAPPPMPLYVEQGMAAAAPAGAAGSFDVAFELLRLHAVASDPEAAEGHPDALAPLLARLLRPSGMTPDTLDYAFCWHLLSLLGAVGALPDPALSLPPACAARMSFISQLECVGEMSHWAVYAALHIPDGAERSKVVRELLMAHVDEWCDDEQVQQFFAQALRLPPAWLAEAQALWAHYCQDDAGRLDHLLAAGDWPAAHALLCDVLAPRWMLAGAAGRLSGVLQQLEEHAAVVNAAGGAGTWEAGGGVYSAFLWLKDLYSTLGGGAAAQQQQPPPALNFQERMGAAGRLAAMLQDASARWGLAGGGAGEGRGRRLDARPGGGAAQQAVFARMSAELSQWVMSDSGEGAQLLPLPHQALLAVSMRGMPHEATAAGLQLAAANLAQRVA